MLDPTSSIMYTVLFIWWNVLESLIRKDSQTIFVIFIKLRSCGVSQGFITKSRLHKCRVLLKQLDSNAVYSCDTTIERDLDRKIRPTSVRPTWLLSK